MQYAKNAYKTAGLSANEYMAQATSFSASLISSLGGDTAKAAEYADMAITDMSDNANKFGTAMEMLQNAYNGFAKQNFTMLDNLKLGYGGTKTEMQRFLKDAESIQKKWGNTVKYSIDSYADIVEAIHTVQKEYEITGTTASEASETISGSFAMMKEAWENLVVGFSDPEQDIDELLNNFVESVGIVGENLIPRIKEMLPRLVEGIGELINELGPEIAPVIEGLLPNLIEGATTLVFNLIENLPEILGTIGQSVKDGILKSLDDAGYSDISDTLSEAFDKAEEAVGKFIESAGNVIDAIPPWEEIKNAVQEVIDTVESLIPWVTFAATVFAALKAGLIIQKIATGFGEAQVAIQLLTMSTGAQNLAQFALNGTMTAFETIVALLTGKLTLAQLATAAFSKGQAALNAVMSANPITIWVVAIAAAVAAIILLWNNCEGFRNAVIAIWEGIKTAFSAAWDWIKGVWQAAPEFFASLWEGIKSAASDVVDAIAGFFESAWEWIKGAWASAKDFFKNIWEGIKDAFSSVSDVLGGYFELAWSAIAAVWDIAAAYFQAVWDTIQGIFAFVESVLAGDFQGAWDAIQGILVTWSGYFQTVWEDIKAVFEDAVSVGKKIVDDIKAGIKNAWDGLKSWFSGLWDSVFHNREATITVNKVEKNSSNAIGLDYVPFNGYIAELHRGEAVLTASEADSWRRGNGGNNTSGITIVQNIQSVPQTPVELAALTQSYFEQARWAI